MWRVLSGNYTFTASATVANRRPGISLTWQGATYFLYHSNLAVTASTAINVCFGMSMTVLSVNNAGATTSVGLPYGWMPPTTVIASSTSLLAAGDQYSAIAMVVEELWLTDEEVTENEDLLERFVMTAEREAESQQPQTVGMR